MAVLEEEEEIFPSLIGMKFCIKVGFANTLDTIFTVLGNFALGAARGPILKNPKKLRQAQFWIANENLRIWFFREFQNFEFH